MRNLSELSLKNKALVWYVIIMTALGGIFFYSRLGRMEDPNFTIKEMVVAAHWPGASAQEMQDQVTDKLERKLQDTPGLDYLTSDTYAGETFIYVILKDELDPSAVRPVWQEVRNLCEDLKAQGELPEGTRGPFYNDRFDEVYGSIYAVTGDGYSYEEMRKTAEDVRRRLVSLPSVRKIELLGVQEERVYVEVENVKLSQLGIPPTAITEALAGANKMTPAGEVETKGDNVRLQVSGQYSSLEEIRTLPIRAGGRVFRLGDIAKVERRSQEPASSKMYFNGQPAIGIAVSMEDGGNILELGDNLEKEMKAVRQDLPVGLEISQVSNQPEVVEHSINEFVETLALAVLIVLGVSFLSLGWRTGLVVAGCIPLVLTAVFVGMYMLGISLQKVSLGALIVALGLLVDDAIIAVEMMSVQLELGKSRFEAACHAFRVTAKPMLTGTLITCAGFIPIAFSRGMAAEFCQSLFPVIAMALLISWLVSVMVAPLFGTYLIKVRLKVDEEGNFDPYQNRFYRWFRRLLNLALAHSKLVVAGTVLAFAASIFMMGLVREEFFPGSLRPELLVGVELPQGASLEATESEMQRLGTFIEQWNEGEIGREGAKILNYSYYVGDTAPRFVLTIDPATEAANKGQFVIVTKDTETREALNRALNAEIAESFPQVRATIQTIQTGPPADYPVMLRVTGQTVEETKEAAAEVMRIVAADPEIYDLHMNWGQKIQTLELELDQAKLAALGITSRQAKEMLYTEITGAQAAEFYTGDRTIPIDLRMAPRDRKDLMRLQELPIYLGSAGYVPLSQIAKLHYKAEEGLIMREDTRPSILVEGNIHSGTAVDATQSAFDATAGLRQNLPSTVTIKPDGSLKDSEDALGFLVGPVPAMVFIIMTLLMLQLGNGKDMLLTLLTAPLGLIGVAIGMLLTDSLLGFVAYIGILALSGMIIRNSVILIDQIQSHLAQGETPYDAIVDSAVLRFRPIMLTAAAAILGMLPLMAGPFWGPMAVAIASGLLAATVLTLLVLPCMYALAYGIKKSD